MPRHGGSIERTRKHRKRRGRNRESWFSPAKVAERPKTKSNKEK